MTLQPVTLKEVFETALEDYLRYQLTPKDLLGSMYYSLSNGGKRIRPTMLLTLLAVSSSSLVKPGLATAIALEFIHTYSLIHDDLPAMDNDDFRRGQPTNHVRFDEATAILAGDGLLTDAFKVIATDDLNSAQDRLELVRHLAQAAGSEGMVGGQFDDLEAEGQDLSLEDLQWIHQRKTGALFAFIGQAAGILADLPEEEAQAVQAWTRQYGVSYQVHNDLLEVVESPQAVGKDQASDQALDKLTYPRLLGGEASLAFLEESLAGLEEEAQALSQKTGKDYEVLRDFLEPLKGLLEEGEHE